MEIILDMTKPPRGRLDQLLKATEGVNTFLIVPHNDPDPDAIASAVALKFILEKKCGIESKIAYNGLIGRAENKALVRYLKNPLRYLSEEDISQAEAVALIDTQPGAGNNPIPLSAPIRIVIDHHPARLDTHPAPFADITSSVGACSTMLTRYLQEAELEPDQALATALFYGIQTDTRSLSRDTSSEDIAAYFYLQPRIDMEMLPRIENAQVPAAYFRNMAATLNAVQIFGNAVFAHIGRTSYPDLAAEMADLLLRLENLVWVICMGIYKSTLFISVRSRGEHNSAYDLIQTIVAGDGTAGGHGMMAGGQIPLDGREPEELVTLLRRRALIFLKMPPGMEGTPLIQNATPPGSGGEGTE